MRETLKEYTQKKLKGITFGGSVKGLTIHALAFADDIALLSTNIGDAIKQIEILAKHAAKFGLQISQEKTKFMSNKFKEIKELHTSIGCIERVKHFKYLGETITDTGIEKEAVKLRIAKLRRAQILTQKLYAKKCLSRNAKLLHYNTVTKTEVLYAAETLSLKNKGLVEDLEKKERVILRKILGGHKKIGEKWIKMSNEKIYQFIKPVTTEMRKRRLMFFGHLVRMDESRLTKKIFNIIQQRKSSNSWLQGIKKDLTEVELTEMDATNRDKYRKAILEFEVFQEAPKTKTNRKLTAEHLAKMAAGRRTALEKRKKKIM